MYAVGTQAFAKKAAPAQTIDLEEGTTHVYLFTDGFQDQFGWSEGKRFMRKQLRDLFLQVHQEHIPEQKNQIEEAFNNWRGNENQVDDVLVLGFKLD